MLPRAKIWGTIEPEIARRAALCPGPRPVHLRNVGLEVDRQVERNGRDDNGEPAGDGDGVEQPPADRLGDEGEPDRGCGEYQVSGAYDGH